MNKKTIWITGASSGIGKALAIKFANNGWEVAASARREDLLKELKAANQNIHPYPLDVTKIEDCKSTAKLIIKELDKIDICVFGTGMHDPQSEKRFNLSKIREIMEVNYFGTMNSINSVYDYFSEKKDGQLSIVSSVAGYRGLPVAGAYCASKSALISFAESLYFDMKRKNVKISVICPGFIKTPMTDKNDFPMPLIKSPEFAADKIFTGLTKKNAFEIHFPKTFTYFLKLLRILPNSIYFRMINTGNVYMKRDKHD